MRTLPTAPLRTPLCLIMAAFLSIPTRRACGFSSLSPSRIAAAPPQRFHGGALLHAATLDLGGSMFLDGGNTNRHPTLTQTPTPTQTAITSTQQRQQKSRRFLTAAIAGYLALLLQKLTWEGLLAYPADCTADMLEASCRRITLPDSMALGTAFVSLCAAVKIIIGSSLRLPLSSLTGWYLSRLEAAPLITKCVTGALIAFSGDYGAQWFEYKSKTNKKDALTINRPDQAAAAAKPASRLSIHGTYNFRRGVARFLECLLISSPLMHYGYDLFERIVPTTTTAASGLYACLAALSHVVADSLFLDGIFVMTGIIATGLLEGHPLKKVLPNLRNVYVPTLRASVVTSSALMPLQFLSFRFLPVQLRVLSVNAVDLIWTGVVSFVSHSDSHLETGSANA